MCRLAYVEVEQTPAEMLPPGPVLYLERQGDVWETEYTSNDLVPAWISGEELLGQGILVTMMTGLDHMPCNMWVKLRALIGEPVKQKEQHGTGNEPCQPVL